MVGGTAVAVKVAVDDGVSVTVSTGMKVGVSVVVGVDTTGITVVAVAFDVGVRVVGTAVALNSARVGVGKTGVDVAVGTAIGSRSFDFGKLKKNQLKIRSMTIRTIVPQTKRRCQNGVEAETAVTGNNCRTVSLISGGGEIQSSAVIVLKDCSSQARAIWHEAQPVAR